MSGKIPESVNEAILARHRELFPHMYEGRPEGPVAWGIIAALTAERDAALARVAELEKENARLRSALGHILSSARHAVTFSTAAVTSALCALKATP